MKIILIILALAAYGAYSLFSPAASKVPPELKAVVEKPAASATAGVMEQFGLSSATDLAATAAAKVSGLGVEPLPVSGCSESALSPSQVLDLLNTMPEAQRVAVAKLLDVSSSVWSAQLYSGDNGMGLCLPTKGKLVRFPGAAVPNFTFSSDSVTDMLRSAGNAVSGAITK